MEKRAPCLALGAIGHQVPCSLTAEGAGEKPQGSKEGWQLPELFQPQFPHLSSWEWSLL